MTTGNPSNRAKATPRASRKAAEVPKDKGGGTQRNTDVEARTIGTETEVAPGPPPLDTAAVARVVPRVEISTVELVSAHFERRDDGPFPMLSIESAIPEMGIDVDWDLRENFLGCVITFGTIFEDEAGAYDIVARFRLLYLIEPGDPIASDDINQFANWNAVFNAWPYWREFVSNMLGRANLPQFIVPVMRLPVAAPTGEQ